jgi:YesN/AraC family two-component response regulator
VAMALRQKGNQIVTAYGGEEGLEKFDSGDFDVVITDIIMPDKDGVAVIDEVLGKKPETRIIAISGGGRALEFDYLDLARERGVLHTLQKPFSLPTLHAVLDKCLTAAASPLALG